MFPGVRGGEPTRALEPVTLEVRANDFITVLGPSGCGKSALLRIVAGLDKPSSGRVLLDGRAVTRPGADRGMVFQFYPLFPWLIVAENIAFGLEERGVPRPERARIVAGYVEKIGLLGARAEDRAVRHPRHEEAIFPASRVVVMSARPGRIKADIPVTLPHPRHYTIKTSPDFSALKARLTEEIRVEAMRAASER